MSYLKSLADEVGAKMPEETAAKVSRLESESFRTLRNIRASLVDSIRVSVDVEGEEKVFSASEVFLKCGHDESLDIRRRAHESLMEKHEAHARLYAQIIDGVVRQSALLREYHGVAGVDELWNRRRGFAQPHVDAMFIALIQECSLFHDYYRLKAKALGLGDSFGVWDLHAPLESRERFTAEETKRLVVEAIHEFDPTLGDLCARMMKDGHVELCEGPTNRSAFTAFCGPALPSLVFVPFQGGLGDVFVLAHEMGHALRGALASSHPYMVSQGWPTLTEVPSIFLEHLLFDFLCRRSDSVVSKKALLARHIESFALNAANEGLASIFQREIHALGSHETLTESVLSEIWERAFVRMYGPAVKRGPLDRLGWCRNNFAVNAPFLNHTYVFANLLCSHLFSLHRDEPREFRRRFVSFLEAGCSRDASQLVESFGIDMRSPEIWRSAFCGPEAWVREFETLVSRGVA